MSLITELELAEILRLPLAQTQSARRYNKWPCVKIGRVIRFTPEQVAHIIATQTVTHDHPATRPVPAAKGQTARSAARGRR